MVRARVLLGLAALAGPAVVLAAGGDNPYVEPAHNDVSNTASLQRGAKYFVNYCAGCHSLKYVRYNRLEKDLGITENQLTENLIFPAGHRPHDTMTNAMPADEAAGWFGLEPPDLSLTARAKGTDYIYSFLKTFYLDESKATGTNNLVLEGASMPHVLWELQGIQRAVYEEKVDAEGNPQAEFQGFEQVTEGKLTAEQYDLLVRDIANFLDYAAEPMQLERQSLGVKVILFLIVLLLFSYLLKKEIWKDVH